MKLLLLSNIRFLMNGTHEVFGKPLSGLRMAYITTAAKVSADKSHVERDRNFFKQEKIDFEEIDLDGQNEESLRLLLKGFQAIFVEGGNTYYLLKSVRSSGFDKVVRELLDDGVIYIGASAGSYLVCPSIEMTSWKGKQKEQFGVTDFSGLSLVPFLMFVHYKPEHGQILKQKINESKYEVKILTDDQAIVVEGDNYKLVGEGEEIKID